MRAPWSTPSSPVDSVAEFGATPVSSSTCSEEPPASTAYRRHVLIRNELRERTHRVRPAARAGEHRVRKRSGLFAHLFSGFFRDNRLEVSDHHRERVRADDASDDVVGVFDVRRPVAHRLGDCFLQRSTADGDGIHFRPVQAHSEDVRSLAVDVAFAHIHLTGHVEVGGRHRRRRSVLSRARLSDDALFAHVLR